MASRLVFNSWPFSETLSARQPCRPEFDLFLLVYRLWNWSTVPSNIGQLCNEAEFWKHKKIISRPQSHLWIRSFIWCVWLLFFQNENLTTSFFSGMTLLPFGRAVSIVLLCPYFRGPFHLSEKGNIGLLPVQPRQRLIIEGNVLSSE